MSRANQILIVEDERDIQELLQIVLTREGYSHKTAGTGEEALSQMKAPLPDLVLLDLMLPGLDGLEVCKRIKQNEATRHVPVVMLTAKGEESDVVIGLELGADDYIPKPFSPKVLTARIKAVLRRAATPDPDAQAVLQIAGLSINPDRHEASFEGKQLTLTAGEFRLLHFLARRPGRVFSRQQIVDGVKGEDYPVTDRAVDVQIVGLRKKLGLAAELIETVRGVGYRFRE